MPFYFRKSISAGPFRFNFSQAGVGVSVGVKGLRLGTGPRGHYVHAGRGGVYYRASLGRAGEKRSSPSPSLVQPEGSVHDFAPYAGVDMIEVESGDVHAMKSEALNDLLNEINEKQRQLSAATVLLGCTIPAWYRRTAAPLRSPWLASRASRLDSRTGLR